MCDFHAVRECREACFGLLYQLAKGSPCAEHVADLFTDMLLCCPAVYWPAQGRASGD